MNLIVTCGPAWEPLDGMRRLTNASTGRLGSVLADAFAGAGHRVTLFRGELSTSPLPEAPVEIIPFSTNDDLATQLAGWPENSRVDAVFHAAALCDFRRARVRSEHGDWIEARKLPTRKGPLLVELEPATKLLPRLRDWFPFARIVGWKYELDGGREAALAAVVRQWNEAATDACVLNGAAWGPGFALCEPPARVTPCPGAPELAGALLEWLDRPAVSRP